MIKLFPSRRVKAETGIDFKLLEKICTDVFEQGFDRKLNIYCKVWKSKEKETSTMERTARKQEKLTTEIIKIYDNFKKAEQKFKRFNLKELG